MTKIRILLIGLLFSGVFLTSCKDDAESPNLTENERNLIRQPWQGEGVYALGANGEQARVDSTNVSKLTLTFSSRALGTIKDVSINGFPGGSWKINGNSLQVKYPAGISTTLDSVTFNISKLTETELNLSTSKEINAFNILILNPEAELRLIPKP